MRWPAVLIALPFACAAMPLVAETVPSRGQGDSRIQWVDYNPEEVVRLSIAIGFQVTIAFGPGEKITSVALGDAGAWQAMPNRAAEYLFVKAKQSAGDTNLIVVTEQRTYSFLLTQTQEGPDLPFLVRFRFPDDAAPAPVPAAGPSQAGRYALSGAEELRPSQVSDDGVRTFIDWLPGQPMPAVFARDAAGEEMLVNGAIREGRYVIDAISDTLVFRRGRRMAEARRTAHAR